MGGGAARAPAQRPRHSPQDPSALLLLLLFLLTCHFVLFLRVVLDKLLNLCLDLDFGLLSLPHRLIKLPLVLFFQFYKIASVRLNGH